MEVDKKEYFDNDELKIYRGEDFVISKYITIHQPTLGEICDFGENKYFNMIYNIVATPQSMKGQLWKMGIDYTTISAYELFTSLYKAWGRNNTSIIFGDLDFSKFQVMRNNETNAILLLQIINNEQVIIDEYTYNIIVNYLCKSHFIEQDLKVPMNESTKMILIEDAIDEINKLSKKEQHSRLKNLISAMINSEGFKYNHTQVWDMKINAFMDSVKRIQTIKNANLLLQSGYSGFGVDISKIDKKQLDWLGELR